MRRYTTLNKNGKSDLAKAHKKLWEVFAVYIKERDKWTCITCGKQGRGSSMHAGHYTPRAHNSLRYDERNVHAQCVGCNMFAEGRYDVYALKLIDLYGPNILTDLARTKEQIKKYTVPELVLMTLVYKQKIADLGIT